MAYKRVEGYNRVGKYTKKCPRCGLTKTLDSYYRRKSGKVYSFCKVCDSERHVGKFKEYQHNYYLAHKDAHKNKPKDKLKWKLYMRMYRLRRKENREQNRNYKRSQEVASYSGATELGYNS